MNKKYSAVVWCCVVKKEQNPGSKQMDGSSGFAASIFDRTVLRLVRGGRSSPPITSLTHSSPVQTVRTSTNTRQR